MVYRIKTDYLQDIHKQQIFLSFILYTVSLVFSFLISLYISKYPAEQFDNKIHEIKKKIKSTSNKLTIRISELEKKSYLDPLTEIYNRRYLDEQLEIFVSNDVDFGMILLDIDHFKKNVNDTFGHDVGDKVLKSLTEIVQKNIRDTDFQARWGGEEFCVILTDISPESLTDIAEKLRKITEKHDFGIGQTVTCSYGVTKCLTEDSVEDVFNRADKALYKAKNSGRNRVVFV